MRVEIDEVRATKTRDFHKVRFEDKNDYNKAKWMLSRLPVTLTIVNNGETTVVVEQPLLKIKRVA